MMVKLLIDLGLWVGFGALAYWAGYARGLNRNREAMRRKAQRKLIKARADTDFLTAAAPPRSRQARIKTTSRRAPQPGPEE